VDGGVAFDEIDEQAEGVKYAGFSDPEGNSASTLSLKRCHGWPFDHLTRRRKARAMARAVPGPLGAVEAHDAAEMGAASRQRVKLA
jgi:hypothetical protein